MLDATTRNGRSEWLVVESWYRERGVTVITSHATLRAALHSLAAQRAYYDAARAERPTGSPWIGSYYIRQASTIDRA